MLEMYLKGGDASAQENALGATYLRITGGKVMIKRVIIACIGAVVLLSAGMAVAGVPCAGTSECNVSVGHLGTTSCTGTAGAFCPAGDQDTVVIDVVIRDCYGNTLAGRTVTVSPPGGDFYFCEGAKVLTTDALGAASTTYTQFGGCGFAQFSATSGGVTIQGNLIYCANFDNDVPANGSVTLSDFARFASGYLGTDPCHDYDCSGSVTLSDFAKFASHYLHSCP
jgi:hypothetical protein